MSFSASGSWTPEPSAFSLKVLFRAGNAYSGGHVLFSYGLRLEMLSGLRHVLFGTPLHVALISPRTGKVLAERWLRVRRTPRGLASEIAWISATLHADWSSRSVSWRSVNAAEEALDRVLRPPVEHGAAEVLAGPVRGAAKVHTVIPDWAAEAMWDASIDEQYEAALREEAPEDLSFDPFAGVSPHPCSEHLGAEPFAFGDWGCALTGAHQPAALVTYAPVIEQRLSRGEGGLLFRLRDTRTGEEDVVSGPVLAVPGCPHEQVRALEALAQVYLRHPERDPQRGRSSLHWRIVDAAALVLPGEDRWPHVHLVAPEAASPALH